MKQALKEKICNRYGAGYDRLTQNKVLPGEDGAR